MTDAHYQNFPLSQIPLKLWIPEHYPRAKDPYYHIFNAAKKKLHKMDQPCWRCGVKFSDFKTDKGKITANNPMGAIQNEIHHAEVEFSLVNAVDVDKFKANHPEFDITDETSFRQWVESEGNLLVLCSVCHRSPHAGIHAIPEPLWKMYRIWRKDLPPLITNP